jgi:hypothetical protein
MQVIGAIQYSGMGLTMARPSCAALDSLRTKSRGWISLFPGFRFEKRL